MLYRIGIFIYFGYYSHCAAFSSDASRIPMLYKQKQFHRLERKGSHYFGCKDLDLAPPIAEPSTLKGIEECHMKNMNVSDGNDIIT